MPPLRVVEAAGGGPFSDFDELVAAVVSTAYGEVVTLVAIWWLKRVEVRQVDDNWGLDFVYEAHGDEAVLRFTVAGSLLHSVDIDRAFDWGNYLRTGSFDPNPWFLPDQHQWYGVLSGMFGTGYNWCVMTDGSNAHTDPPANIGAEWLYGDPDRRPNGGVSDSGVFLGGAAAGTRYFLTSDESASSTPAGVFTLAQAATRANALYCAGFVDAQGKPFSVEFRAATDDNARAVANAIAGVSDARWDELTKRTCVPTLLFDGDGNLVTRAINRPAAPGSDVQRLGRAVWDAGDAGNVVRAELPSVWEAYVSRTSPESALDPLDDTTRPYFLTEAGSPATKLRQVKFDNRVRKD